MLASRGCAHPGRARRPRPLAARGLADRGTRCDRGRRRSPPAGSPGAARPRGGRAGRRSSARLLGWRRRGRATAPTACSPGSRDCSGTTRWSPRCRVAVARRPSACAGCRGATRATTPRTPSAPRVAGHGPRAVARAVYTPALAAELLDDEGARGGRSRDAARPPRRPRGSCAPRSPTAAARSGPGPARGSTTCAGGIASPAAGVRSGTWWSGDTADTSNRVPGRPRRRPRHRRGDLRLSGAAASTSTATGRARSRHSVRSPEYRGANLSCTSVRARSSSSDCRVDDSGARRVRGVADAHRHRGLGLEIAHPVGAVTAAGHAGTASSASTDRARTRSRSRAVRR